jgi:hypothetical protein
MAKQTQDDETAHKRLLALGRLSEARKWFEHRGWHVLPQNDRGQAILRWGADHAWLAAPTDQKRKRSVRNWCRRWEPRLSKTDQDQLVADTVNSNKRWTHDQSAPCSRSPRATARLSAFVSLAPMTTRITK